MTLLVKTFLSEPYKSESTTHHEREGLRALLEYHHRRPWSLVGKSSYRRPLRLVEYHFG
jgi:hypothetical protein